jgi:flagellar protein FliO/FliZ
MRRFSFALLLLAAVPAWAQSAQSAPSPAMQGTPTGMILQALFGLAIVLGLMVGAAWLLKRFNPIKAGQAGNVRIVGGVSVGSRERVIVVEVADQWIVVGVAPGNVNALSTMPRQDTPGAGNAPSRGDSNGGRSFSSWLKQSVEQRNARS